MDINLELSFINILLLLSLGLLWFGWIFYTWSTYDLIKKYKVYSFWTIACVGLLLLIIDPVIKTWNEAQNVVLDFASANNNNRDYILSKFPKEKKFNNFYDVLESHKNEAIDTLFIIGNDINIQDFKFLDNIHLHFEDNKTSKGFTYLSTINAFINVPFKISGSSVGFDTIQIVDSNKNNWTCSLDSSGGFEVEIKINSTGLHNLSLKGFSGKDIIVEPVPVMVRDNPKWNMLVWSSYPSYDINYHKNYWAKNGYGYALRQNISQKKVQSSFVNMDKFLITRVNDQLLSRLNFLNVDISSWNGFSAKERAIILNAIKYKGLTCIIRPQKGILQARDLPYHNLGMLKEINSDADDDGAWMTAHTFKGDKSWRPINFNKITMAMSNDLGIGKVVINLIEDTYPLILSGQGNYYSTMWAHYYSKIFQYLDKETFISTPFWNWENQELNLDILNYNNEINEIKKNGNLSLPLIEVPGIKGLYRSTVWPSRGWNEISTDLANDNHFFYSFANHEWSLVKHNILSKAAKIHNASINNKNETYISSGSLSFWWSYGLMLLGFGGLWLMERLD